MRRLFIVIFFFVDVRLFLDSFESRLMILEDVVVIHLWSIQMLGRWFLRFIFLSNIITRGEELALMLMLLMMLLVQAPILRRVISISFVDRTVYFVL